MDFRVAIDGYSGPLDLLLQLVRKDEVEAVRLSLSDVIEQYIAHVEDAERIDTDSVGDFLEVASVLIEIKSRRVLPGVGEPADADKPLESQDDLVHRLLEYREFRALAERLEERNEAWRARRPRLTRPAAAEPQSTGPRPIERLEVWDLVSAFSRIMRERLAAADETATIRSDPTPVHVHMRRLYERLQGSDAPLSLEEVLDEGPLHKTTLIGLFLALLELVRGGHALASQRERFGPLLVTPGPRPLAADFGDTPNRAAG
ncbi:MAG: ScpA family protein [Planctomycetota bacterium]